MNWWPIKSETLVLPVSSSEVLQRMQKKIRSWKEDQSENQSEEAPYLFNGRINENRFRISRIIDYPENFLPLITGTVENTSGGSIVFLKYQLFMMTLVYLIFWSLLCLGFTFYFGVFQKSYLYALLSCGFGVAQYAVAMANFDKQVTKSRKQIERLLTV